jgi:glycosyltransferase involved in cell wall biosynthesis
MKKILIIIPAYNEEDNILKTYNSIKDYKEFNYDALVINDGSKDNTEKILLENNIPHINLIQNLGIGGAVQTGYKYALMYDYDIVVQFDGDGQHDINYVKNIIKPIINNQANMVIGSRFILPDLKGFKSSKARRCGINVISKIIRTLTHKKVYDPTSGFRAVDKNIIKTFSEDYPTEYPEPVSEVNVLKHKFIINEVPVVMHDRIGGKSSIHAWKNVYYMINVTIAMFIESIKR